ncbi:MAG: SRPBCC family protein, partial [Rhodothermales bacterium]|nr:SRPBCC family protein [Rhodothermales bacterium]
PKVGPVPLKWTSLIDVWEPGRRFVDSQLQGPYSSWWHEHRFVPDGDGTLMTDTVYYAAPAGPLGGVANALFVGDELRKVFGYRSAVVRARFGADAR